MKIINEEISPDGEEIVEAYKSALPFIQWTVEYVLKSSGEMEKALDEELASVYWFLNEYSFCLRKEMDKRGDKTECLLCGIR